MNKILSILLFVTICINHLHIFHAVIDFNATYKKEKSQTTKNLTSDEESETEKENKGKEKIEEKYYSRNNYILTSQFQLSEKDKFICFKSKLNIHPYQEDDIQPPRQAV